MFNLLGPLSNPASVKRQLIGVYSSEWVEPLAHVLKELGSTDVWVVHGDGMDEITVTAPTMVAALKNGSISTFEVSAADAGLAEHPLEAIKGGDAVYNAQALRTVLEGEKNAYRDIVLMNAGAGLIVAGMADDMKEGAAMAAAAIDNGTASRVLSKLVAVSNEAA